MVDAHGSGPCGRKVVLVRVQFWALLLPRPNAGLPPGLPDGTLSVWLRVSPGVAVRRASGEGLVRPLLAGADPLDRAVELIEQREVAYGRAQVALDSDENDPATLAKKILTLANTYKPSAMGLSFLVEPGVEKIEIQARAARYETGKREKEYEKDGLTI